MSQTDTTTWHLECDICCADGGETVRDGKPPLPKDWHQVGNTDICPACVSSMTFQDFLTYWAEAASRGRAERQRWAEHAKARRALLAQHQAAG
jgi:hypothetical protein